MNEQYYDLTQNGSQTQALLNSIPDKVDKAVSITYAALKALRDGAGLKAGQYYRITDYVTTVNEATITNARSASHPFDLLVRADSATVLNEQAWAVRHDGDTYFKDARLEAWELKYRLDNVQWSKQAGTYVTDEDNGYTLLVLGDITLSGHTYKLLQGFGMYVDNWSDYALMETVEEGEPIYCYYGDPEDFDPEEPEEVGTASSVDVVTEGGKGTITWMKDEQGNECPYDFKNVQFKRYMATDSVSGRDGLGGKYMVADPDNCPQGLSVEDTEDFIWAYTFSSDNSGGEQTDYSLTAAHSVHDNVFRPYSNGLPNNVMFGEYNYSNSFGFNCYDNSWGNNCSSNSLCNRCYGNSWGNSNQYNSWGNNVTQSTLFEGVQYTQITTENVKNVQVLNGVAGTSSSKLTLTFAANKTYTQVAAMTSAGALKIYVPGDLA